MAAIFFANVKVLNCRVKQTRNVDVSGLLMNLRRTPFIPLFSLLIILALDLPGYLRQSILLLAHMLNKNRGEGFAEYLIPIRIEFFAASKLII